MSFGGRFPEQHSGATGHQGRLGGRDVERAKERFDPVVRSSLICGSCSTTVRNSEAESNGAETSRSLWPRPALARRSPARRCRRTAPDRYSRRSCRPARPYGGRRPQRLQGGPRSRSSPFRPRPACRLGRRASPPQSAEGCRSSRLPGQDTRGGHRGPRHAPERPRRGMVSTFEPKPWSQHEYSVASHRESCADTV